MRQVGPCKPRGIPWADIEDDEDTQSQQPPPAPLHMVSIDSYKSPSGDGDALAHLAAAMVNFTQDPTSDAQKTNDGAAVKPEGGAAGGVPAASGSVSCPGGESTNAAGQAEQPCAERGSTARKHDAANQNPPQEVVAEDVEERHAKRPRQTCPEGGRAADGPSAEDPALAPAEDALASPASPNPNEDVEDWERREDKRVKAIDMVKGTSLYQDAHTQVRASDPNCGTRAPTTPDPHDRAMSKRKWERVVLEWRAALHWWNASPPRAGGSAPKARAR